MKLVSEYLFLYHDSLDEYTTLAQIYNSARLKDIIHLIYSTKVKVVGEKVMVFTVRKDT